jgi:hypothetical protein
MSLNSQRPLAAVDAAGVLAFVIVVDASSAPPPVHRLAGDPAEIRRHHQQRAAEDSYLRGRYASRSAMNEPSHSSLPTIAAMAVPVNEGVLAPRAISVAVIVFGSIIATA